MAHLLLALLLITVPFGVFARALDGQIPENLQPWVPWVLGDEDQRHCPMTVDAGQRLCAWPGRLHLDLDSSGGLFAQRWQVSARSWVPLPGDVAHWPEDVRTGDEPVAVVERDGRPVIDLGPGDHAIHGRYGWNRMPQGLPIPPQIALLELRVAGSAIRFPRIERNGRLWLKADAETGVTSGRETLALTVQRRVEDDNPLRILTRLEMDAAGKAREVVLGPILLAGGVPLELDSPLPARLEPDGRLRVQLRPGHWVLEATAYHAGPVDELILDARPAPWPDEEVWVFAARPDLRQVEVNGGRPVDPRQTRLPSDWAQLPAYLLRPSQSLRLQQLHRGAEEASPDRLTLDRELWLDFDGGGYTLRDRIAGKLTRSWRLEAEAPLKLGRVEEGGAARFITRLEGSAREGVEVRQGALKMTAVSRIDQGLRSLPATAWALNFQSLGANLHLPPGWRLFRVTGVDNLPDTWLNRWSLLDLFLVLLITIGAWRLWGPLWGGVALVAMLLTWHELGAPRLVWLNLLAAVALLRVLPSQPEGTALARLRRLVRLYYRASLLVLAALALPFLVEQTRLAIYPQLQQSGPGSFGSIEAGDMELAPRAEQPAPAVATIPQKAMHDKAMSSVSRTRAKLKGQAPEPIAQIDPDAMVQTGPGVPAWTWTRVRLDWNGPVSRDHRIGLWLVPPGGNLILTFVRITLVLLFVLQVAGLLKLLRRTLPTAAAVVLVAGAIGLPAPADAGDFPSSELLNELRERLLEPADCLPACADIPLMTLRTEGNNLHLELTLDAAEAVAVPVPGSLSTWGPSELHLNGAALDGLRRSDDGHLLVALPPGRWRVKLIGPLPPRAQVEVPLPLRPRQVIVDAPNFRVQGIDADGRPGAQIQLVRVARDAHSDDELEPAEVPPLVRIVRTLQLGLDWRVETHVSRLSSSRFPLVLEVPLVEGEQVLDADLRIEGGRLLVSLPAGRMQIGWSSSLAAVDRIELRADNDPRLSEEWRVDVSPQWHLDIEGIPVVHHQGQLQRWLPTWRPWPGEQVTLLVSRPAGVPGPTLTLTESKYRIAPGRRSADAALDLTLLSSQGGRHSIRLPQGAVLTAVRIDGRERPLRLEDGELILPLVPTKQRVAIEWSQPAPIALHYAPQLPEPGVSGVNAELRMELGQDRWVLFTGGPTLGPAVLFWGFVFVLVLIAIGLGHSRLTPLRTWDWLLLGLGLSQAGIGTGILVAVWLFALGLRSRWDKDLVPWRFNLMQVGLIALSLGALVALVGAIEQGLLGLPEMQIEGNGSSSGNLVWFQDRTANELPQFWVVSVPVVVYRGLMLAWALWLAFRLIAWLRWGWQGFSSPMLWREMKMHLPQRRRHGKTQAP